jgi:acetoin utilization deacetylase AcuC-like enzyme
MCSLTHLQEGSGGRCRLLPALRAFDPDIVLLSAGFDGTKGNRYLF